MTANWHRVPIRELGRVVTGSTPRASDDERFAGTLPFITPTDLDSDARTPVIRRFVSDQAAKDLKGRVLPPRSVCFTCIGATIGKLCLTSSPALTNQQINSIVVDDQNYDPGFVYYRLLADRESIKSYAGGAATPIISKSAFESIEVSVPSLPTQRKIGVVLSTFDDLIENNNRRITILEEMAQRIYREWFVDFRYPGHEDVPLVDSELGPIPNGWTLSTLGSEAGVNHSTLKGTEELGVISYVDISSVSPQRLNGYSSIPFAEAPGRARRVVRSYDVLWSTVRPNRRSFVLLVDPPDNCIASTGFAVLSARHVAWPFLYLTVSQQSFADRLANLATGAAYPAVTPKAFESAPMVVPPPKILASFGDTVAPLLELASALVRMNSFAKETRDLLLPRLISGEIDVEHLHIPIDEAAA